MAVGAAIFFGHGMIVGMCNGPLNSAESSLGGQLRRRMTPDGGENRWGQSLLDVGNGDGDGDGDGGTV